jgi:exonuclease SbcC
MQILSIRLKNIKVHRNMELSFSPGINVLSGPNGVGKSTVFEAIGYALFGVDARDFVSNVERFLSIGAKKGEISVIFQVNPDETWQVSRTVGTPARWLLARESNGIFEVEEHARLEETEARIAGLLGLANGRPLAEQFKLVIGPFQNDFLGPFIIKQPTRRQETFDEILGIDAWRKTYKGTSSLLAALQKKMEILAAEVKILEEQTVVLPQKGAELTAIMGVLEQKQQELQESETALKELEAVLLTLADKEKALSALIAEIGLLESRIKDGGEKITTQKQRVDEAQQAAALVEASCKGKEAYDKVEARLVALRAREQQRRTLEQEIALQEKESQRLFQSIEHEQQEIAATDKQLAEEVVRHGEMRLTLQADDVLLQTAALLVELRPEADRLKAERSLLAGRRAGLVEGQEKLAHGVCPFSQEQCLNVAERTPRDFFSQRVAELQQTMAALDERIAVLGQQIAAAEHAEKKLGALTVRLQELDKQVALLDVRRQKNRDRATNLENLRQQQKTAAALLVGRQAELQVYATLDQEIEQVEQDRTLLQSARDTFIAHEKIGSDLESRRLTLEKWQKALADLQKDMTEKQNGLARCRAEYQAEKHQELRTEKDRLLTLAATQGQQLAEMGRNRQRLEVEIARLKQLQQETAAKQAAIKSAAEKEKLVKFLRNQVFKNVSAQLSERFREEISLRGDRIYRTIAESDEELVWGENYQIILRDMVDGVVRERSDDQLSGGQTMSAVVALRLALLQTIGARIAFFDEPTSNLDAARRENLAHAFRAIDLGREEVTEHWYDQLFLVSHDVAFTEITDQMINLESSGDTL